MHLFECTFCRSCAYNHFVSQQNWEAFERLLLNPDSSAIKGKKGIAKGKEKTTPKAKAKGKGKTKGKASATAEDESEDSDEDMASKSRDNALSREQLYYILFILKNSSDLYCVAPLGLFSEGTSTSSSSSSTTALPPPAARKRRQADDDDDDESDKSGAEAAGSTSKGTKPSSSVSSASRSLDLYAGMSKESAKLIKAMPQLHVCCYVLLRFFFFFTSSFLLPFRSF